MEPYLLQNIQHAALENENRRLRRTLKARFKPTNIIGNSKPMQEVYRLIEKLGSPVLLRQPEDDERHTPVARATDALEQALAAHRRQPSPPPGGPA